MNRILVVIFIALYASVTSATPGSKENHALVIIDMQPRFVTRGGNHEREANAKKVEDILATQVKMIEQAKKSGIPIVFLEYESYGDTNSVLKDAIGDYKNSEYFLKNTDGMFSNNNKYKDSLVSYLEDNDIGSLIIAGANGGACVKRSISGSLDEGYNVIAFSKGIADFNYRDFIYPYDDQYTFSPNCEEKDCIFKEIDELSEYSMTLVNGSVNIATRKTKSNINDDDRNSNNKSMFSFIDPVIELFSSAQEE